MDRLCMGCMKMYDDSFEICPHCGYAFHTPPLQSYHLEPGTVLQQRYIVGRVLGYGGFGVTYLGWDYVMERKLAIKEYLPGEFATRIPGQTQVSVYSGERTEQFRDGLLKTVDEARRLARFEHVPGIVQIYDSFEENGTSYIVMEFLEGETLKEYLGERGKLPVDQALTITLQVASAMEQVHKEGLLHRDIAPDNIYVLNPDEPESPVIKILDFGAARYATTKHSKSLSVIIKPGYAPEEQYRSRGDQGTWTDVYALAAVFYKMITGITPEDAMERSVDDGLKKPSRLGVKISKPMETALMNALNIKIQDRTQTMQEFSQELLAAEVKERRITPGQKDPTAIPRWVFAAAAVGLAAVVVTAALLLTGVIGPRMSGESSRLEDNMTYVPNVVNHQETEAQDMLESAGLGMRADHMVYSGEIPADMVTYQEIKENTRVEKNTDVVVWISMGEETAVIPSLVGLQREEALALLEQAGFANVIVEESDEEGAYDSVLAISEEEGLNVALSTRLVLTVCIRETAASGELTEVPDVLSVTREEAETAMEEAGLLVTWAEEFSEEPEGTILSMDPEPGEAVYEGTYVTIRISRGPEKIYMTNVRLETREDAIEAIEALGLQVGTISTAYSDTVEAGKVISQSVAQNEEVKKGDTVDLTVSLGRAPEQETAAETEPETTAAQTTAAPPETTAAVTQPETTAETEPETTQPQTEPATEPAETEDLGEMLGIW